MRKIISICGGSGSGKSTLAKALAVELGDSVAKRLPGDYFLLPNESGSVEEYFETGVGYDWNLITSLLAQPLGTKISIPDFDFTTFKRISLESDWKITLREIMIIDALTPYPEADFTVFMQMGDDERKQRIIARDEAQKINVISNWDAHQKVVTNLERLVTEFDLVLDGGTTVSENVKRLVKLI